MRIQAASPVDYDAIVVGARPAGAATALLLARQGRRVLVADRGQYGTDTLSSHALMRAGGLQLLRFGVMPGIAEHAARDERDRDVRVSAIFEVTDRIASFDWSLGELGRLHKDLARAMSDEVTTLNTRTGAGLLV